MVFQDLSPCEAFSKPSARPVQHLMDSMDSIDLLHKIAKTPNLLGGGGGGGGWISAAAAEVEPPRPPTASNGGHMLGVPPERPAAAAASSAAPRHKLVKQKSLNRTLSTSVLRIKKKRSFWSSA